MGGANIFVVASLQSKGGVSKIVHTTITEILLQCKNYFLSAAKIAQQLKHATINKKDCTAKNKYNNQLLGSSRHNGLHNVFGGRQLCNERRKQML